MIRLDEEARRRMHPRRGREGFLPSYEEARAHVKQLRLAGHSPDPAMVALLQHGAPPTRVDGPLSATAVIRALRDSHVAREGDAVMTWLARGVGPAGLVAAMARSRAGKTGYAWSPSDRERWASLARVTCAADDEAYAKAVDVAQRIRKDAQKNLGLRTALALAFPELDWATEDARAFDVKAWGAQWSFPASQVLAANEDLGAAKTIVDALVAKDFVAFVAPCAYALVDRLGEAAAQLLAPALAAASKGGLAAEADVIGGALATIGTGEVAALMRARLGKKAAGTVAESFFRRFPELAGAPATTSPASPARIALYGTFDVSPTKAWRAMRVAPDAFDDGGDLLRAKPKSASPTVGDLLDTWSAFERGDERLVITVGRDSVEIRGVVGINTFEAHGADIVAMFRVAPSEKKPPVIEGELVVYALGAAKGAILSAYDRWESSIELIDERLDDDERVREAVATRTKKSARRK